MIYEYDEFGFPPSDFPIPLYSHRNPMAYDDYNDDAGFIDSAFLRELEELANLEFDNYMFGDASDIDDDIPF